MQSGLYLAWQTYLDLEVTFSGEESARSVVTVGAEITCACVHVCVSICVSDLCVCVFVWRDCFIREQLKEKDESKKTKGEQRVKEISRGERGVSYKNEPYFRVQKMSTMQNNQGSRTTNKFMKKIVLLGV